MTENNRIICPGLNDLHVFTEGWYGLQRSPEGLLFRSSEKKAALQLAGLTGPARVVLYLSARPEHAGTPLCGRVSGEANSSFAFQLGTNQWTTREGELEFGTDGILTIEVENPWSPDRLYNNGDARSLGIMLSAVRIMTLLPSHKPSGLWTHLGKAMEEKQERSSHSSSQ